MALFATPESARQALTEAENSLSEWESKHASAIKERETLEAESLQRILNDPSQAEHYAFKDATLQSQIRVYSKAINAARAKILDRHEDLLKAEAKQEDKLMAAAYKDLDKHDAKVKIAQDALEKLQGAEYQVQYRHDGNGLYNPEWGYQETVSDELRHKAETHKLRAHVIREFLETGEIRNNNYGMGALSLGQVGFHAPSHVPASVRAAKAAGLKQEG